MSLSNPEVKFMMRMHKEGLEIKNFSEFFGCLSAYWKQTHGLPLEVLLEEVKKKPGVLKSYLMSYSAFEMWKRMYES